MKSLLIGLVLSVAPGIALACTPAARPVLTRAQQLEAARKSADAAASPVLAAAVREAAEISVVRVDRYEAAPLSDIPERYRENIDWYRRDGNNLEPVRYRLKVARALKGSPPAEFVFRFRLAWFPGDGGRIWTVAPNADFDAIPMPRSEQAFWQEGFLGVGQVSGGPGDCSNQIALDPTVNYLVFRDGAGLVTAAEPLVAADPLPDLVAALVADPSLGYPWRPSVTEFLKLPGLVVRVRITSCRDEKARVIETLRRKPEGDYGSDPEQGTIVDLYRMEPGFLIARCQLGAEYLMTGWPFSTRLHPISKGQVTFEDRWMQLRFTGEKTILLETVRTIVRQ